MNTPDEEAHYYHIIFDFVQLVKTYGWSQVLHDLDQIMSQDNQDDR